MFQFLTLLAWLDPAAGVAGVECAGWVSRGVFSGDLACLRKGLL